ncbi:hypothetical protein RFI_00930, partial [Reticulomyxa filosa]
MYYFKNSLLTFSCINHRLLFENPFQNKVFRKKNLLNYYRVRAMLLFEAEAREEEIKEDKKKTFLLSECYSKSWISLTNEPQRLDTLICCVCNQVVNNAMELHCDEHEDSDQVYLVGEECLQQYLKQNNGKCPIQQHDHCEFSQGRTMRKLVFELFVICPRQFDLKKRQSNEGIKLEGEKEEEGHWNGPNSAPNSKNYCNFKGKIKDLKDHLDKSCNLISTKQINQLEIANELNAIVGQIKELQNVIKLQTEQYKHLKADKLEELVKTNNKQINDLKHELLGKDKTIAVLTNNIQQLKIDIDQHNIEFKTKFDNHVNAFKEYKQIIGLKLENQKTN